MSSIEKGIFIYKSTLGFESEISEFQINSNISSEALLLRLLAGTVAVSSTFQDDILQKNNYLKLPFIDSNNHLSCKTLSSKNILQSIKEEILSDLTVSDNLDITKLSEAITLVDEFNNILQENAIDSDEFNFDEFMVNEFGVEGSDEETDRVFVKYFEYAKRINRKFYDVFLFELSSFFVTSEISPTAAFLHLYRMVELVSFNIPLVYTSKSRDYIGTFKQLKTFFSNGDKNQGELSLLKTLIKTLFDNEEEVHNYQFEFIVSSENIHDLIDSVSKLMSQVQPGNFSLDYSDENEATCKIKFTNVIDLVSNIRNRYFHLKDGDGQPNIKNITYNMDNLFYNINPHILNWLAILFFAITKHGLKYFCL